MRAARPAVRSAGRRPRSERRPGAHCPEAPRPRVRRRRARRRRAQRPHAPRPRSPHPKARCPEAQCHAALRPRARPPHPPRRRPQQPRPLPPPCPPRPPRPPRPHRRPRARSPKAPPPRRSRRRLPRSWRSTRVRRSRRCRTPPLLGVGDLVRSVALRVRGRVRHLDVTARVLGCDVGLRTLVRGAVVDGSGSLVGSRAPGAVSAPGALRVLCVVLARRLHRRLDSSRGGALRDLPLQSDGGEPHGGAALQIAVPGLLPGLLPGNGSRRSCRRSHRRLGRCGRSSPLGLEPTSRNVRHGGG